MTAAGPGRDDVPRVRLHRAAIAAAGGVVLVALAVAILGHVAQWSRLREALERMRPGWLPVAVVGVLAGYAGYVAAYRRVAAVAGGPRLRPRVAAHVVGLGFGATVLGASVGGLAIDYWALHRAGCGRRDAVRRVLALNTLQWTSLAVAAAVAGALALTGPVVGVPVAMALAWLVVVPVCVAIALWVSAPARLERLSGAAPPPARPRGAGGLARWSAGWARVGLAEAIGGLGVVRQVLRRPLRNAGGVGGFALYWAGNLLALYACLRAFGVAPALGALVLAFATGYVATALPLPVGGAGGVDASLALTLTAVGAPLAAAVLAAVLYRGVAFWLPIAPAAALLPTVPALARELDASAAERGGAR